MLRGLLRGPDRPAFSESMPIDEDQEVEILALEAIYGDEECSVQRDQRFAEIHLHVEGKAVTLRAHLTPDYPAESPPVVEIDGQGITESTKAWASQLLEHIFLAGEPVIYAWAEAVRERLQEELEEEVDASASDAAIAASLAEDEERQEEQQQTAEQRAAADRLAAARARIISGDPLTERKSTFQAHLAPVTSKEEVAAVMEVLLQHNKIARATHNISAHRIWVEERQLYLQDCDDDGESAAAGRLLHMLESMNVRDVVVVVSRWYGGVLMGPQRFTIINNTARLLLEQCGYDHRGEDKTGPAKGAKKK